MKGVARAFLSRLELVRSLESWRELWRTLFCLIGFVVEDLSESIQWGLFKGSTYRVRLVRGQSGNGGFFKIFFFGWVLQNVGVWHECRC